MEPSQVKVLLVDDDDIDAEAIRRAFKKVKILNPIHRAKDGNEALDMLRGTNQMQALERPYIILLDINMPGMDGIEFLETVRDDDNLSDCVVFMLTTSTAEQDKVAAYKKQVAGYVVKQNAGEDFLKLTAMLNNYWRVVELPEGHAA